MLPKQFRLSKKRDFVRLAIRGRSIFGPYATLRVVETRLGELGRVAFITSTKMMKRAVDRNRTKRRLREVVRGLTRELPRDVNLLFVAKPEARVVEFVRLVEEIKRLVSKIPEALKQPPRPSSRGKKHRMKLSTPPTLPRRRGS